MNLLKNIFQLFIFLILVLVGIYFVAVNYAVSEEKTFKCVGNWSSGSSEEIYFKFTKHRWSREGGSVHIERENRMIQYVHEVRFVSGWGDVEMGKLGVDGFSGLSKKINWRYNDNYFEGQCADS